MATIGDLVGRLERQAYALEGRLPEDTVQSHRAGWILLAKPTLRAISYLPVGGRREYTNASIDVVLKPLATAPRKALPYDLQPAPRLVEIAQTMGVIADILSDTVRFNHPPGLAGDESLRLEASLLSAVHLVACWSRSSLQDQTLPSTRHSLMASLADVAVLTQPWAMIPPVNRASTLETLRIPDANAAGIEGAVVRWADQATSVLRERYRPSGRAMQAIAGTLAMLSERARQAVQTSIIEAGPRAEIANGLVQGVRSWIAAASWPPTLRLGGNTESLRYATAELREQLETIRRPSLPEMKHALEVAQPVALLHATVLTSLIDRHGLWIHGYIPGSSGEYARKWSRVPSWSDAGRPLAEAAQTGYQHLQTARSALDSNSDGWTRSLRRAAASGWPPSREHTTRVPDQSHDPLRDRPLLLGPDR